MKLLRPLVIGGGVLLLLEGALSLQGDRTPTFQSRPSQGKTIAIESIEHQKRNSSRSAVPTPFSRHEGADFGFHVHNELSVLDLVGPLWIGRGIASGDFNNDGWQDIVLATNKGILLYKNVGGTFALQRVAIPELSKKGVHVVAFVDINNDGWQDMYATTYGGKNYFIINDKEGFGNPEVRDVPNTEAVLTEAASFGDVDRDGDLDLVHGNWFFGSRRQLPSQSGRESNTMILHENLQFREEKLQEIAGQTLSILLADFTNDHAMDLIVGNDFYEPDIFHIGDGKGGFQEIVRNDELIPSSTFGTMSMDVADFNNDLFMDIYAVGVYLSPQSGRNPCFEIENQEEKTTCERNFALRESVVQKDLGQCIRIAGGEEKKDCGAMITIWSAWDQENETLCERIPQEYTTQQVMCRNYFADRAPGKGDYPRAINQVANGNILLQGSASGKFQDVTQEKKTGNGWWAWNAKFADLDNDEWQDIYVANGFMGRRLYVHSNVFFHNYAGQYFETEQEEFGLENYNIVNAYTYLDIDNDGDVDIIAVPVNGPLNVYINNETENNLITFAFKDREGNYFGIGNTIYIYYGQDDERHQVRQIKSGGGFLSFDPPLAHFGLGRYDTVNRVEIVWSTGERTTLNREFLANKQYTIERGG